MNNDAKFRDESRRCRHTVGDSDDDVAVTTPTLCLIENLISRYFGSSSVVGRSETNW